MASPAQWSWTANEAAGTLGGFTDCQVHVPPPSYTSMLPTGDQRVSDSKGSATQLGSDRADALFADRASASQSGGDRADALFADRADAFLIHSFSKGANCCDVEEDDGEVGDQEDGEIDAVNSKDVHSQDGDQICPAATGDQSNYAKLRGLLRDTGAFHDLCTEAFKISKGEGYVHGAQLQSAEELCVALNFVCMHALVEGINDGEAAALFAGPLDAGIFYQLARGYLDELSHALAMDASTSNWEMSDSEDIE